MDWVLNFSLVTALILLWILFVVFITTCIVKIIKESEIVDIYKSVRKYKERWQTVMQNADKLAQDNDRLTKEVSEYKRANEMLAITVETQAKELCKLRNS